MMHLESFWDTIHADADVGAVGPRNSRGCLWRMLEEVYIIFREVFDGWYAVVHVWRESWWVLVLPDVITPPRPYFDPLW